MSVDFNTQLSVMNGPTRQKIDKGIEELSNTTDQLDLTDICKTLPNINRIHIILKEI